MHRHIFKELSVVAFSLAAVVIIIFSGFAAWSFNNERREDISTGVSIRQAGYLGTFDTSQLPRAVVLEEGKPAIPNNPFSGIVFYRVDANGKLIVDSDVVIRFLEYKAEELPDPSYHNIDADNVVFAIRLSVVEGSKMDQYFELSGEYTKLKDLDTSNMLNAPDGSGWKDLRDWADTFKIEGNSQSGYWITEASENGERVFNFSMNTSAFTRCFEYKPNMRPTTDDGYQKLYADFADQKGTYILIELWQGFTADALPAATP